MSRPRRARCYICDKLVMVAVMRRIKGRLICRRHASPELDIEAMTRA